MYCGSLAHASTDGWARNGLSVEGNEPAERERWLKGSAENGVTAGRKLRVMGEEKCGGAGVNTRC